MPNSDPSVLDLGDQENAFSRGGNRLCFVHPQHSDRCIKVPRPDRLAAIKRREKSFPKNLKPLHTFDDNYQEAKVYDKIERHIGSAALDFIPACYGYTDTNWGPGLCSELIRDDDGHIAITLKQYLWQYGKTAPILDCLQRFCQGWQQAGMPSRNLLLHNIVVQCRQQQPQRLVVIDGLGWPDLLPLAYWLPGLAQKKAGKRIAGLHRAVDALLDKQQNNKSYGYHGWIEDEQRKQ